MRGICGQKKIGHTGTLDPQATGVLPVCLGSGTKLCDMLTDKDKEYVAELLLGVETDTQDTTGQVLRECPVEAPEGQVYRVIMDFVGNYNQTPPMYSALKVDGRRLYELARAGVEVKRKARVVTIYEIEILKMQLPVVKLRVGCSRGTYIRTLCADIGGKLGCGGAMQSLVRTRVGDFKLNQAVTLSQLQRLRDEDRIEEVLTPVDSIFSDCPALHVPPARAHFLENGNALAPDFTEEGTRYAHGRWVRMYHAGGEFAGVYAYDSSRRLYKPVKMFLER